MGANVVCRKGCAHGSGDVRRGNVGSLYLHAHRRQHQAAGTCEREHERRPHRWSVHGSSDLDSVIRAWPLTHPSAGSRAGSSSVSSTSRSGLCVAHSLCRRALPSCSARGHRRQLIAHMHTPRTSRAPMSTPAGQRYTFYFVYWAAATCVNLLSVTPTHVSSMRTEMTPLVHNHAGGGRQAGSGRGRAAQAGRTIPPLVE